MDNRVSKRSCCIPKSATVVKHQSTNDEKQNDLKEFIFLFPRVLVNLIKNYVYINKTCFLTSASIIYMLDLCSSTSSWQVINIHEQLGNYSSIFIADEYKAYVL